MRYSYAHERWTRGSALLIFFLAMTFSSAAFAQEFRSYWKFGLNIGFNEARMTCRSFEHPKQAGIWIGGNGSCQGAWSDLYTQTYLRSPSMGAAWVRFDANLSLSFEGERRPGDEQSKVGNSNLFMEAGHVIGRDALIWGGKRNYKKEELWVLGMMIVNEDSPGFGIYNIDVGDFGRIGAAYFHSVSNRSGPLQSSIDFRLEEIPLGTGRLNLINVYTETGSSDARTGDARYAGLTGNKTAVIYRIWTPDSTHHAAAVYGKGLFGGMDSENYEQGPLIDSTGSWRDYTAFLKDFSPELRNAVQQSSTFRMGYQYSYYPGSIPWQYNLGFGMQKVNFGGLRFLEGDRYFERADMDSYAAVLKVAYNVSSTFSIEPSFAHLKVVNGLGYRHREPGGTIQESLRPVSQRLSNMALSLNVKPIGRWQQNFSLYAGRSYWNDEIRRDIAKGNFPERTSGFYAGISTSFEM